MRNLEFGIGVESELTELRTHAGCCCRKLTTPKGSETDKDRQVLDHFLALFQLHPPCDHLHSSIHYHLSISPCHPLFSLFHHEVIIHVHLNINDSLQLQLLYIMELDLNYVAMNASGYFLICICPDNNF